MIVEIQRISTLDCEVFKKMMHRTNTHMLEKMFRRKSLHFFSQKNPIERLFESLD